MCAGVWVILPRIRVFQDAMGTVGVNGLPEDIFPTIFLVAFADWASLPRGRRKFAFGIGKKTHLLLHLSKLYTRLFLCGMRSCF